jgi:hypothetical protein
MTRKSAPRPIFLPSMFLPTIVLPTPRRPPISARTRLRLQRLAVGLMMKAPPRSPSAPRHSLGRSMSPCRKNSPLQNRPGWSFEPTDVKMASKQGFFVPFLFRFVEPLTYSFQRGDSAALAFFSACLHQSPEPWVAGQQPIDEIGILRAYRDHFEGRLAIQSDHDGPMARIEVA